MTNDPIARLAAANPLPDGAPFEARERVLARVLAAPPRRRPSRRFTAVALVAAAIAVPAAVGADVLGLGNGGTPVATSDVVGRDATLTSAMAELRFPDQVADLGERAGFHFYVARNPSGSFCFTISAAGAADEQHPKAIGCAPAGFFPSQARPLLVFAGAAPNRLPADGIVPRLLGFAADGVATVDALDADGATVASAAVVGNVYAEDVPQTAVAAIVARDASGNELYRIG